MKAPQVCCRWTHLDSGYLVSVARLLVYMCPPTSMWTGALALVSWAGDGMPWAVIGDEGERLRDILDMLRPSCDRQGQVRTHLSSAHLMTGELQQSQRRQT